MELDLEMASSWIEQLHGDSAGYIHVCATGNWSGQVCRSVEQAVNYIRTIDLTNVGGIYVRATTLKNDTLPAGSRGGEQDTACLPAVWADIDIAGPGHKTAKPLPPTRAAAKRIIAESGLPEPTLWVHSGGGLYPWWMLQQPHCPEDDDLDPAQSLLRAWQKIIAFTAASLGWHYGTEVADLSRVLRIPGTINRKVPDDPRLCQILGEGSGQLFDFAELRAQAADLLELIPQPEREPPKPPRSVTPDDPDASPGDALEGEPWHSPLLLGADGWRVHHETGDTIYWTRPGKELRDGWSATTGRDPTRDRLYVFSSATEFEPEVPYTKFGVFAVMHGYGNDFAAAAKDLRNRGLGGHGDKQVQVVEPARWSDLLSRGAEPEPADTAVEVAPEASTPEQQPVQAQVVDGPESLSWQRFSWDDLGNAQRFARRYRDRVRWLVDVEQWMLYDDGRWVPASASQIGYLVTLLWEELYGLECDLYSSETGATRTRSGEPAPSERERFAEWVGKLRTDARVRATISQAKCRPELWARRDDFDRHPMLLNCANGVLDLSTGELREHDPELLLTQRLAADFDPTAECPMWEKYLSRVVPDGTERDYLQRISGYTLTGDVSEQTMFLHHGHGANGKSVYTDVLGTILGGYTVTISAASLLTNNNDGAASEELATMHGKRMVRASETNVGKHLDEGRVKTLTGGDDMVRARYLYQGSFEYRPTGKIHLMTNHAPDVSGARGIWRRISVVSWRVEIPPEEWDKHLARNITDQEASGVLTWAVMGCLAWQQRGLDQPDTLALDTQQYRRDQDLVQMFIEECIRPVSEPNYVESSDTIYQVYRMWAERKGARPMSLKSLVPALTERGLVRGRTNSFRGFEAVRVITPLQAQWE